MQLNRHRISYTLLGLVSVIRITTCGKADTILCKYPKSHCDEIKIYSLRVHSMYNQRIIYFYTVYVYYMLFFAYATYSPNGGKGEVRKKGVQ